MATIKPDVVANPKPGTRGWLKWYWCYGPGAAKWVPTAHPWTNLYRHLVKHMSLVKAKRTASQWYKDVFHMWPGERKGKNPLGPG